MNTPSTRKSLTLWQTYRRLFSYLRPYRLKFITALLAMAAYGATDGAVPYILKRVLDDVFGSQNEQMLWHLVQIIMLFAVVRGLFGFFERYLIASVGLNIIRDIRNQINSHLLSLSADFFGKNTSGSLMSRMSNDTLSVRVALVDAVGSILRDSVRVIALLSMALYLDPVLGVIAFVGFPIALYPVLRFGKKVKRLSRLGQDRFGGLSSIMQEILGGHKVVQSFCREDTERQRFEKENAELTETLKRAEKYGALSGPSNEVLASLAIAAVIIYGGMSVIGGVRTQGDFIAFITSMLLLYEPLKKIGRVNTSIQTGAAAAERIFEILDVAPIIHDRDNPKVVSFEQASIKYLDVSFAYPEGENAVGDLALKNVSLSIKPGETLALVGMSGGGKSTLVNLLPRFFDPTAGEIKIADVDLRDLSLASLRKAIATVSQHTFLFNESVFYNIAYGKEQASEEEVFAAAKAAYAHDFISRLPEGYRTVIGEQGFRLSGGERARIAIARALLKNAPILILDEATASLDSESETLVQHAVESLMKGRTTLVIAHRLSTVRKADRIAVLKHGQIVELGKHEELLKREGEYAKLYRLQFRDLSIGAAVENFS